MCHRVAVLAVLTLAMLLVARAGVSASDPPDFEASLRLELPQGEASHRMLQREGPYFAAEDLQIRMYTPWSNPDFYPLPSEDVIVTVDLTNSGPDAAEDMVLEIGFGQWLRGVPGSCAGEVGTQGFCAVGAKNLVLQAALPGADSGNNRGSIVFRLSATPTWWMYEEHDYCLGATLLYDADDDGLRESVLKKGQCETGLPLTACISYDRSPVLLPALGRAGSCESWIDVQSYAGHPAKALLVTFADTEVDVGAADGTGAAGAADARDAPDGTEAADAADAGGAPDAPDAEGAVDALAPALADCTGLIRPGGRWRIPVSRVAPGSKSGVLYLLSMEPMSDYGLDVIFGFDAPLADLICQPRFLSRIVGDLDEYRRVSRALTYGSAMWGLPMDLIGGWQPYAASVSRSCATPGSDEQTESIYGGLSHENTIRSGPGDPGYRYSIPMASADENGLDTRIHVLNGGWYTDTVALRLSEPKGCGRSRSCGTLAVPPGSAVTFSASDCVDGPWSGSAWLETSEASAIVVDLIGPGTLASYRAVQVRPEYDSLRTTGPQSPKRSAHAPLVFRERSGSSVAVAVQNVSGEEVAKVRATFLNRDGTVAASLVDWLCPLGSAVFDTSSIAALPDDWVGSARVDSLTWKPHWAQQPRAPGIAAVVSVQRSDRESGAKQSAVLAYAAPPDSSGLSWVVQQMPIEGFDVAPSEGSGRIGVPAVARGAGGAGSVTEIAIVNAATAPGMTHALTLVFDQNGPVANTCHRLAQGEAGYVDLASWGFLGPGFRGGALVSATSWDHRQYDEAGFFERNDVYLVAASATTPRRSNGWSGVDASAADASAAAAAGIPLSVLDRDTMAGFGGFAVVECTAEGQYPYSECGCGPLQTDSCTDCPVDLPPFGAVRTSVIDLVPRDCRISDLDVLLDIDHPYPSDLTVKLTDGHTTETLFSGACAGSDGITVVLDDEARDSIEDVCPSEGERRATTAGGTALRAFYGGRSSGKWTLVIEDRFPYHRGTLNRFELRFRYPHGGGAVH